MTAIEVTLESMAHGGSALGRYQGQVVFVPYTIPGEVVLAEVREKRGRVIFADGRQLLEASVDRVFPTCPHFGPGRCAGCLWQHIDYPAQLLLKQDVLSDQLERLAGLPEALVLPVIAAAQQWGYNHHLTLRADAQGRLGLPTTADGLFVMDTCAVAHPALEELYRVLELEEVAGLATARLQIGSDGALMLVITTHDDEPPALEMDLPLSVNLLRRDGQAINLGGDMHSVVTVAGRRFRVGAASVLRPNFGMLDTVAAVALQALNLRGGERVLNLFAGVGIQTAFLAEQAGVVYSVEPSAAAWYDTEINLAELDNVELYADEPEQVIRQLGGDACLVDAPTGLTTAVVDALGDARIERVVVLSADPALLARDAKRLLTHGYRLEAVQPIDLAPQTHLIDSVAAFSLV